MEAEIVASTENSFGAYDSDAAGSSQLVAVMHGLVARGPISPRVADALHVVASSKVARSAAHSPTPRTIALIVVVTKGARGRVTQEVVPTRS